MSMITWNILMIVIYLMKSNLKKTKTKNIIKRIKKSKVVQKVFISTEIQRYQSKNQVKKEQKVILRKVHRIMRVKRKILILPQHINIKNRKRN